MKKFVMAAAMLASTIGSAHAVTIVQTDNDGAQMGVTGFDSRLGKLERVTYEITFSKARTWSIVGNVPLDNKIEYSYIIGGSGNVTYFNRAINAYDALFFPLYGQGKGIKDFSNPKETLDINVAVSGHAIFDLDPLGFIDNPFRIIFDPRDPGYYGATDTRFQVTGGVSVVQQTGNCGGVRTGEDFCGFAGSKLTYYYNPAGNQVGAVPEPGTWMMMILGFGAVGYTMRRKKAVVRFV